MSGYAMGQAPAWAPSLGCKWAWALTQAFRWAHWIPGGPWFC